MATESVPAIDDTVNDAKPVDSTFIQDSRVGRCSFQIRQDQLEVSWLSGAAKRTRVIRLQTISPDYSTGAKRVHAWYIAPAILAAASVSLASYILSQDVLPGLFALYPLMFAVACVWGVARGVPRVEYFKFDDHWHRPLFYVVRERRQERACNDFIQTLLKAIERIQSGEPLAVVKPPPANATELPSPEDAYLPGEIRWQISLILGGLSLGAHWFSNLDEDLDALLFWFVFGCSVGGLVLTFLSYQAKERLRHLSLLGALLSVTAVFFYNGALR